MSYRRRVGSPLTRWQVVSVIATLVLVLISPGSARQAQTIRTWDGGGADNNWSTAGNWSSDDAPDGTTEAALFTNDVGGQAKRTANLSADVTIGQLQFSASAPSYTITGTGPSTLFLSPNQSFGGVGVLVASGAANQSITAAEVEFLSSQTWDIGGTTTLTVTGTIEDAATPDYALTKNGTGTLVFPGDVRYDGPTTVNAGAMVLSFSNTSMLSALTVNNGGLLRATTNTNALGSSSTRNTITMAGGALELANDTSLAFGSASRNTIVTGNATIRSDRLTAGAGVTHTLGPLNINASTLSVTAGGNVTSGTAGTTFRATTLSGNATLNVTNSASAIAQLTLAAIGQSGGTRSLTKTGSGTLVLNGAASYTGGTTLSGGTLTLGVANALGSGGFNFAGGTLNGNNIADSTIGALTLSANSVLNLSPGGAAATLTFAGTSGVAGGTLTITGWSGPVGGAGTNDRVVFSGGTTPSADFLQHIRFDLGGGNIYFAALGAGGELIPSASGPSSVAVPAVVLLAQPAATSAIAAAGLTVGTVTTALSSTVPPGSVISQSPLSGTLVAPGSAVGLVISSGPAALVAGTTGAIEVTALPPNLNGGQFISQTRIRLMHEGTGFVTAGMHGFLADAAHHDPALGVGQPADDTFANAVVTPYAGPGLPAVGTRIYSVLLHFDPNVSGLPFDLTQGIAQSASITFDRPIIGVYVTSDALDVSDGVVGSGTIYPNGNIGRDMEFNYDGDDFSISPDRLTLSLTMFSHNGGVLDEMRVILADSTPPANVPPAVALTSPADHATGLGASVLLTATVTDTDATTVTFHGRKTVPQVPGPDFVIGTLPDTQFYSENVGGNLASIFFQQTQWYADHRAALNLAFISHMGDMVQSGDNGSNNAEWNIADLAMRTIEDPLLTGLPYGIPWGGAPGNHDQTTNGQVNAPNAKWNQFFGAGRWAGRPYFGGSFLPTNNSNSYYTFEASGLEFLVIHLDYTTSAGVSQAVIDWADALMKANPDRRAIVASHWILDLPPTSPSGAPAPFGGPGQRFFDEFKDNPNFFLMLSGHQHGEGRRADVFGGRTIYSVLQDYQARTNGGDGWLRYFVFSPATNTITAKTYSSKLDQFESDTDTTSSPLNQASEFVLSYNMQTPVAPWTVLGTVNVPAGGGVAQLNWSDLDEGATYEWYVTASDGASTTTSPIRNFSRSYTQTVTTIAITPSSASLPTNGTQSFSAVARDQFGALLSPQPVFNWSVTGGGTINAAGLFTAGASAGGPFTVTATNGSVSASASVTVTTVNVAPTVVTAATATPNPVTGTTTGLSALGADDAGEAGLTYTWATTGTPPAAVTFTANGNNAAKNTTTTFTKAGNYTFQVTIRDAGNLTVTSAVAVTVTQTVTTIAVAPASASVVIGATQAFTATASDQFAQAIAPSPTFTWTVTGGGTTNSSGLFTAGAAAGGPFQITARNGTAVGTANVTVTSTPAAIAYVQGTATTNDASAATMPLAFTTPVSAGDLIVVAVSWGNNATLSCSDSMANSYVVATSQFDSANNQSMGICFAANARAGATTVTASFSSAASYRRMLIHEYSGIATTSPVDVVAQNIANGTTAANAITSNAAVTIANGDLIFGAVMDDAGVTGITAGTGFTQRLSLNNKDLASEDRVLAAAGSIAATHTFAASHRYIAQMVAFKAGSSGPPNAAPTVVTAANASPNPVSGATTTLSALGADDGGEAALTYTWATTGTPPAAVTFSANGTNAAKNTTATFTKSGTYTFQVTIRDAGALTVTSTVAVTVTQTVTTIAVTPPSASVGINATQTFSATAADQFGLAMSPQPSFAWSVSGGGAIDAGGLFTAGATAGGPFTVTASSGAVSGVASVNVTPVNAAPTVATAAGASPSPVAGTITSLNALGADDGGEANLTYTWATTGTPPAAVTFSANGTNAAKNTTATFTKSGNYSFQVTIRDAGALTVTSTVAVTVTQTVTTIAVTPATASVVANGTQAFSATAADQFGLAVSPQPSFTWSVSGGGTINASGLFTAGATAGGPFVVTASSGGQIGTANVTVTAASAVAFVQGSTLTNDASGTTIAKAFTSATAAGNLIVAAISWGSNATVSCSDSQGNIYAVATTQYDSVNNQSLAICYAANTKAGATTVTATFSATTSYKRLLVHEYRGIALVNPVDGVAKNLANGTTAANAITSTAVVTTVAGDLIFGAVMDDAGVTSVTSGTGFTQRVSVNNKDLVSQDQVQAAAGSIASTFTFGAAHRYLAQLVAFKKQ